ncbi:recQ-mediated genome instability protein 1-like [Adelges cooleyi]|uniref:recQ-mediated genome instability protein 1-like n=1 Tax=Adelges cooleyi TaxID=133065 RepID=UPI00217F6DDD|nr:recQ-mediated genome instability protein 1-like [Adelges cooleyi]XP_050440858.1 recQ-mediated genome instability protein 1-like [Adelges cooleyi]XP_050440859.1 recQ-mediated genome instability protein 1-like [Adelges cooleyi]XP_050440860.1 recQ-mediated genome instability protein 1-like [Adelges cooleyi]XP_050440861.1 recQ-mediated genome instability protein 1-like [Adelges cooleyi]XP_050440862.1 recQ-mediated genome instability protein 1-like [Adelges cooleyi]
MTVSSTDMYGLVSQQLKKNYIVVSRENEWFKQCIDFFKLNNQNINIKDLSLKVAEQLSLADFKQISLSCLPTNLNNNENTVLQGTYSLQVNTIINIGQSCYSQYNTILKKDISNSEVNDSKPAAWEPKLHRMLKLSCTDGQQDVLAMEYESLPILKEPFVPGFKITVIGPVEYRKGVILLKPQNLHLIGGEVDDLLISNAPLNVLCKILKKPLLANPYTFSEIEIENTALKTNETHENIQSRPAENVRPPSNLGPPTISNQSNRCNTDGNDIISFDDFMDDDEADLLCLTQVAELESRLNQPTSTESSTRQLSLPQQHKNIINTSIPENISKPTVKKTNVTKQTKLSNVFNSQNPGPSRHSVHPTSNILNTSIETNNSADNQISAKREASSSPVHAQPKRSSLEFQVTDVEMDTIDFEFPEYKTVNEAKTVQLSKIQVKQNKWICSGKISYGTIHEDVEFSTPVLERLIGVLSHEVAPLRENPNKCRLLKEKIEKGIKFAERKLYLYKGKMVLKYYSIEGKKPCVVELDDLN